jgi:hypothetical protein
MKQTIVITGCDAKFYPYMEECLNSLVEMNIDAKADIAILDLGLSADQVNILKSRGFIVKTPTWPSYVSEEAKKMAHQIGLVARTALREYFPGYSVYLWFDADAWAQTPEFFDTLVGGALDKGAAVIRENGSNYKRDFMYTKWWFGNMMTAYGVMNGLKVCFKPSINIGILALSDKAPHWEAWIRYYQEFIRKRGKVNNQHSFNAALELEHLPHFLAPARTNWITTLSTPMWNSELNMVCEPNKGAIPLSVIHLAGPKKDAPYALKTTAGGEISTPLTYNVIKSLMQSERSRQAA